MQPFQLEHTILQGATFDGGNLYFTVPYPVRFECGQLVRVSDGMPVPVGDYEPRDFTDCTARMQLRKSVESQHVLAEFSADDGTIAFDGPRIYFPLTAAQTAAMVYGDNERQGKWNLAIGQLEVRHSNGRVERIAEITWYLNPESTR